jgi:hypothetical protein
MKVFVLGGYGKVGLPASKLLATSDLVTEIAVAGRNLERAEKAAKEIGKKAAAVHVVGTDEAKLASVLAGYDIVLNAASNKVVLPAIRAATRTGAHYCDVAFGKIVQQTLQLASEAEAAGITAILANGFSPGLSSTMGVHVARQLDEVEQLQHGLSGLADFGSGRELTPRHWLEQPAQSLAALPEFNGFIKWMLQRLQGNGGRTIRDYREGRWGESNPIQSGLELPLPQGRSLHAHPFTCVGDDWGALPGDIGSTPPVGMWFSALPPQLDALLREQALRVLEAKIALDAALRAFYDAAEGDPRPLLVLPDDYTSLPYMWVRAVGRKEGRAARCTCSLTAPMWDVGGYLITSAALVAAACKIMRGEVRQPGVMTAETAFEPRPFYDELATLLSEYLPDGQVVAEAFEWLE